MSRRYYNQGEVLFYCRRGHVMDFEPHSMDQRCPQLVSRSPQREDQLYPGQRLCNCSTKRLQVHGRLGASLYGALKVGGLEAVQAIVEEGVRWPKF